MAAFDKTTSGNEVVAAFPEAVRRKTGKSKSGHLSPNPKPSYSPYATTDTFQL